jgi:antitoxin FitA
MATLLIRGFDDNLKKTLRKRAADNGRSMEEEARRILQRELVREAKHEVGLGTWLVHMFGGQELEIAPRTEYPRKPPFVTDEEWKKTS